MEQLPQVNLLRTETGPHGTFGILVIPGKTTLHSLELPWKDNKANVSCIPTGKYKCLWTYSPAFGRMMYILEAVPKRSGIRIHSGNYAGDKNLGYKSNLLGCISFGTKLGVLSGQKVVLNSVVAVRQLESAMNKQPFILNISWGI